MLSNNLFVEIFHIFAPRRLLCCWIVLLFRTFQDNEVLTMLRTIDCFLYHRRSTLRTLNIRILHFIPGPTSMFKKILIELPISSVYEELIECFREKILILYFSILELLEPILQFICKFKVECLILPHEIIEHPPLRCNAKFSLILKVLDVLFLLT